ncbi:MAG: reverse transcriptase domain-containing protein [Serratia sp. (in: enterobacteria)]|uniref:reverse transcriptase domain-containing protein n=1 Tax=Serratia sp. (in: enterobacteria) TaxID=616 RepID=UPI003F40AA46
MRWAGYTFVCRTDIRGYYANIQHTLLLTQLRQYINHPEHLDLLSQFLHYTVEDGGHFHSPRKGIPRASALSPLLAAFHLTETDRYFEQQPHLRYARFMDDFLIFTRTRHQLRRAVKALNQHFALYGFEQHPDKTFISRLSKGTDWMGFQTDEKGCGKPAPRAVNNMLQKLRRLYEQIPAPERFIAAGPGGAVSATLAAVGQDKSENISGPSKHSDC